MQTSTLSPAKMWALRLALLVTTIAAYTAWLPAMPAKGLDPAWSLALDYALEHGFVFGRDIIFTFGPYFSVYTGLFNPLFDARTIAGGISLGVAAWAGIAVLARQDRWRWLVALGAGIAATGRGDTLYLLIPLLFALLAAKVLYTPGHAQAEWLAEWLAAIALLFAMSLLCLMKGPSLVWSAFSIGVSVTAFLTRRKWLWAAVSIAAPLAFVPLLLRLAGQPLEAFPEFLRNIWFIASGYNQAMHSLGDVKETFLLLFVAIAVVRWIAKHAEAPLWQRAHLCLLFAAYWALAIKISVVRHDAHALVGGHFGLLAAPLLGMMFSGRKLLRVAVFALLVCVFIDFHNSRFLPRTFAATYTDAAQGLATRLADPGKLAKQRQAILADMANNTILQASSGSADLYPSECSLLLAAGNSWQPRPIFQSYSAYTPELAELNKQHLLGPKAPETIFFHVDPIDNRYPTLEDGPSWPTLLARYTPVGFAGDYAVLRHKQGGYPQQELTPLSTVTGHVNTPIVLPQAQGPIFVVLNMRPTLFGSLANLAYKYNRFKFEVELEDGSRQKYRITPIMARTGFVISPLVTSGHAFATLYSPEPSPEAPRVRSMTLMTEKLFGWQWHEDFQVVFSAVNVPQPSPPGQ